MAESDELTPAHKLAASRLFLTQNDVDDLIWLAQQLKPGDGVIDLGAGTGNTALAILQTKPGTPMVTVDISRENLGWAKANLEANNMDLEMWLPFEADAAEFATLFQVGYSTMGKGREIALLLHDADHSEEAVKKDLGAWIPLMSVGAYVWVHDYLPMTGVSDEVYGVKPAIVELVELGVLEPVFTRGIGFIAKVKDPDIIGAIARKVTEEVLDE